MSRQDSPTALVLAADLSTMSLLFGYRRAGSHKNLGSNKARDTFDSLHIKGKRVHGCYKCAIGYIAANAKGATCVANADIFTKGATVAPKYARAMK